MKRIAILQPFIPHYRDEFFKGIKKKYFCDLFCYDRKSVTANFKEADITTFPLRSLQLGPFLLYNPFLFFNAKYSVLVLMLHIGHISTWFLLITKFIHRKEIILWGQGISVKRYLLEEKNVNFFMKLMIRFSDKIWLYTDKEKTIWEKEFPRKCIVSLNNTLSDVDTISQYRSILPKLELKKKYKIEQNTVFIFSARFSSSYRRTDLLEYIIKRLDPHIYGFIIIGSGIFKPDFSTYENVYDFNDLYDRDVKNDLFVIADLYLQPGWVGLSVVEALAYGKPILTFARSQDVLQCVEYHYLIDGYNSLIFNDVDELCESVVKLPESIMKILGFNANEFAKKNLSMNNMITQALNTLN